MLTANPVTPGDLWAALYGTIYGRADHNRTRVEAAAYWHNNPDRPRKTLAITRAAGRLSRLVNETRIASLVTKLRASLEEKA